MKKLFLFLIRLSLIVAPIINIYVFATEGAAKSYRITWWQNNSPYVIWSIGAYLLLLLLCGRVIAWRQIVVMGMGAAAIISFYFDPNLYGVVLEHELFVDNETLVPLVPYIFAITCIALVRILRPRRPAKPRKIH